MTATTTSHPDQFWAGIITLVNRIAPDIAADHDIDIDDLASDTIYALTRHAARNPEWVTDGRDKSQYIGVVTVRSASRLVRQQQNVELKLAAAVPTQDTPINQRDAWDEVLETFGAVDVNREFVSEYIATRLRKMIRTAGGVEAILNRWEDGNITADETYALFNPWGTTNHPNTPPTKADPWQPPSHRTQATVARMLRAAGPYAYELWNLAVREATRYDQRSRQHERRGHRHVA